MTTEVKLETLDQRLSYIVGENMAHQLKNDGIELDTNAFAMAVADVAAGNAPRLSEADKRSAIEEIQKISEERQKAKHAANIAEGAAYLEANSKKDGVITTDSGLQYKSLAKGDGKKPTKSDTVKVHYKGTLIDGTPFDSSYDRGEPAVFPVGGVIAGWTEALQLMNVGDKFELTIPSDLAYGPNGSGQAIGPNATLVFEVELLGIE
ncbi:MAG: FKBP-type peptidyl-prolyl cis-trans isomerase [Betaproteobacteria bacterium]|jgi:FKBP-type peptidyl-prolyl cis-trans isomerase|nr:FKBP-type peptidyl-prolyl cis-trans isomerase [Betaproteobacteria bacterium]MCH9848311.1 FKBP-type peptidyl-prolyl cis-trans isomerase [Betaproteobacteria bacterium]MDG1097407.1 FKBP-type peptidyl-prolyl cis-trans isomerase [Methylophilaceae bacterium]MDG1453597.1 FKBP-type peptidyl-prolyl cis-trans isomerase [Methylophilaceae bacterium]